jgi:hypothetical protein
MCTHVEVSIHWTSSRANSPCGTNQHCRLFDAGGVHASSPPKLVRIQLDGHEEKSGFIGDAAGEATVADAH